MSLDIEQLKSMNEERTEEGRLRIDCEHMSLDIDQAKSMNEGINGLIKKRQGKCSSHLPSLLKKEL